MLSVCCELLIVEMKMVSNKNSLSFDKSLDYFERAKRRIPAQAQTFSKGWTQFPFGASPLFAQRADGGFLWDVDGNRFIDWPMALGPLLLGHNYPAVVEAVRRQLGEGIAFSLPHKKELELAERLVEWFPFADMARFAKNGSDVTTGAVRAARAYTGRDVVLCCGYHGWHDWFIGTTTRSIGVPADTRKLTISFPYNNITEFKALVSEHRGDIAAVIMEPIGVEEPGPGYLEEIRKITSTEKIVLVFDECWSGFRVDLKGAAGKYGVFPDLGCYGKALGNGVPIAAIVGQTDLMRCFDDVFFSFTFGGDLLGISAALSVLTTLSDNPVLESISTTGTQLLEGMEQLIRKHQLERVVSLKGYPARHFIEFTKDGSPDLITKTLFQQEAIKGGVLATAWHAPSYAHTTKDVETTLSVYDTALEIVKSSQDNSNILELLEGSVVQPVFRQP